MKKILVIDDEQDVLDMFKDFLTARSYAVTTAVDGADGLAKFDADNPDVILCDIKMPNKDGFQFLKELRSGRKWVPVIIISALTEPASIFKGYDVEADYYITKPVNLEDVLKAVQIMLSLAPLRRS